MFAVLKTKTYLTDDYDARIKAPRALRTAALPVIDEEAAFPVEDDENGQAPKTPRALRTAVLPVIDEEAAFPVEDDENGQAPKTSRILFALPAIHADEDLVPVLDEDAPLPITLSLVRTAAPVIVDEEEAFPIEDEEGARAQLVPRPLQTILPIVTDEEATTVVIEEGNDVPASRVGRKLAAVQMPDVDDDFPTPPPPPRTFFPSTPLGAPSGDYVPQPTCISAEVHTALVVSFVKTTPLSITITTAKITASVQTGVVSEKETE